MKFEQIIALLGNPMVLTPIGLFIGGWLKKAPWFNTKVVPMLNIAIAALVSAGAAIVVPQHAFHWPGYELVPGVMYAGFGGAILRIFWDGFLQGALTTGIHSAMKNSTEAVLGGKVKW